MMTSSRRAGIGVIFFGVNVGATFALANSGYYSATDATLNSRILPATSALSGAIFGGAIEHAIGKSFSIETHGGSAALQQWYRTALNNVGGAKLILLSHGMVQANGSDPDPRNAESVSQQRACCQLRYLTGS